MYKEGNMCLTSLSIIVRASYRHVRMNAILFIYILHVPLSFHRDTIYLFYYFPPVLSLLQ